MEQDILVYIDDKEKLDASAVANSFAHKDVRNRAYINTLGAELVMKYLVSENFDVSSIKNIHSIKKILEDMDIADIMLPNIHIDVRVVFDENEIFIPKSHFEYNLTPDIYLVLQLSQDKTFVKFLGFFEPKLINKNNANSKYYFIEKEKLSSAYDLVKYINLHKGNTNIKLSDEDMETSENFMVSMSDNDISENDKKYLIKQLTKSAELRDKFTEYENFETLSYKAMNDPMIEKKEPKQIIENENTFNFDEIEAFEENAEQDESEENIVPLDNLEENASDTTNIEALDIPEPSDIIETPVFDELSFDATEEPDGHDEVSTVEDISFDNIDLPETQEVVENSEIDTLTLDDIEIPQEETILEDTTEEPLSIDDTKSLQEFIPDETDMLSLDNIEPISTEEVTDNLEENTISLDDIETVETEEIQPVETTDNVISLDDIETVETEEIQPEESADNVISLDDLEPVSSEEIATDEIEEEKSASFDDIDLTSAEIPVEEVPTLGIEELSESITENTAQEEYLENLSQEFVDITKSDFDNITETENKSEDLSFGKNLLENLSAENDEVKIEELNKDDEYHEEISSDDLLSQIDDVLSTSSIQDAEETNETVTTDEVVEPEETSDYAPEMTEEDIPTDENEMPSDSIDNILNGESELNILYSEENDSQTEEPVVENEEQVANTEEENNYTEIPGAALYNKKSMDKKSLITASALIAVLAIASAFYFLKPKDNTADIEPVTTNNETPIVPTTSTDDLLASNTPQIPVQKDVKTPKPVVQELKNNPQKPIKSESYLEVNRLVWDVPDALSHSSKIQNYLRTAGRSIKLSLSADLLLATEYAYTNQVKVGLKLDKNGSVQDARILSGSGSTQIDNIVLQSVKDTLNVVKPPSDEIKTPDFNLNLIIYF